jgi:hypothetical protein
VCLNSTLFCNIFFCFLLYFIFKSRQTRASSDLFNEILIFLTNVCALFILRELLSESVSVSNSTSLIFNKRWECFKYIFNVDCLLYRYWWFRWSSANKKVYMRKSRVRKKFQFDILINFFSPLALFFFYIYRRHDGFFSAQHIHTHTMCFEKYV